MNRIISVFSNKGGVGQTALAFNLSIALVKQRAYPLLFLDLQSTDRSHIHSLVEAQVPQALTQMAPSPGPHIERLLQKHAAWYEEGIDILCLSGPKEEPPSSPRLKTWLNCLSATYAWVVIDANHSDPAILNTTFSSSSLILLPVTADPLSLDQTREDIRYMLDLGVSVQSIHPVLNGSLSERDLVEAERCLRLPPLAVIPEDVQAFRQSVLKRRSIFASDAGPASNALLHLARTVQEKVPCDSHDPAFCKKIQPPSPESLWAMKRHLKERLLQEIDLKGIDLPSFGSPSRHESERDVESFLMNILNEEDPKGQLPPETRLTLRHEVLDECLGYGALQALIDDSAITEIMVNGTRPIFVERQGMIEETNRCFETEEELLGIVERILAPLGRRVDEKSPMADGRLPDGSRVNAIIRPLAVDGPTLTIRKFSKTVMGPKDLEREGSLDAPTLNLLRVAVQSKVSLLISGGTGSGKTTLLNALSSFIPTRERIITIEDAAELLLQQPHVVRLESRPPGIEGKNAVTIRQLVVNALRMRPTRIIVGECRSGEALDMLQAMNTGHAGSMTTLHANSPIDALHRLETLVLMSGDDLPLRAVREQIASAIGLILHLERFSDGTRKLVSVTELKGLHQDHYKLIELFRFRNDSPSSSENGIFESSDSKPDFLQTREEEKESTS